MNKLIRLNLKDLKEIVKRFEENKNDNILMNEINTFQNGLKLEVIL